MAQKTKKTDQVKAVEKVEVEHVELKPVESTTQKSVEMGQEEVVVVSEVDKYVQLLDKLQTLTNEMKEIIVVVKLLQKENQKLQKQTIKKSKKNVNGEVSKRNPSGFAKPTKLSDELCDFLGVEHNSSMARTIVTKNIIDYVKVHGLQNPAARRMILPDVKLNSILTLPDDVQLTYFNLQTYIKHHFIKEEVVPVPLSVVAV